MRMLRQEILLLYNSLINIYLLEILIVDVYLLYMHYTMQLTLDICARY